MISIIIPTYNAAHYLPTLLESLKRQTLQKYELIIIDSSSTDDTVTIAKQYTDSIIIIPQSEFDHGGTRAKAAKVAKGDILVFFTQDALPYDNETLKNLIQVFDHEKIGAAYGRQLSYPRTNIFGKHLRMFNYTTQSYMRTLEDKKKYGLKTAFLSDSFAAYRRIALEQIGWFKENLILGEDMYAGAQLLLQKYQLAYVSDAQVYHSHSYTIWQEFKRYFDIGVFHNRESWLLNEFGHAEGEGMRYIKSEFNYLLSNRAWFLLGEFVIRNGMKFIGYKLGKNYNIFPLVILKKFSMHASWWNTNNYFGR